MRPGRKEQSASTRLLTQILHEQRWRIGVCSVLVLLTTGASLALPMLVGEVIDHGKAGDGHGILVGFGVLLAVAVSEATTRFAFNMQSGRVAQDALFTLRRRAFSHVQGLSVGFLEKYTSGRTIARLTSDVESVSDLLSNGIVDLVTNTLFLVGVAILLFRIDAGMAGVVMGLLPLAFLLVRWFRVRARVTYREVQAANASLVVHVAETAAGIRAIHAFGAQDQGDAEMSRRTDTHGKAVRESVRQFSVLMPGLGMLGRIAAAVVLVAGAYRIEDGALSIGELVAVLLYVRRFFDPLAELSQVYNSLQTATAALETLADLLDAEPAVPPAVDPKPMPHSEGTLSFEGVSFGYGDREVLHALDLTIPAGQTVALLGPPGAGKSTIARLAARLWDPTDGAVRLDGVDLRELSEADLRRHLVMLSQEPYLFTGSIADNVRYGRPEATDDEVVDALTAAGAWPFVSELPLCVETNVQSRGARLSAGQRQLVALARAFVADPAVLVLDEATAALDVPTEQVVQEALGRLLHGRTAVIIAHRLSTVAIADRILVVDDGVITEDGMPADLQVAGGSFGRLYDSWQASMSAAGVAAAD
jgi:ATP-binding cassette subfamily B protein